MKNKNRLLTLLILSAGAGAATAVINKAIKLSAASKHLLDEQHPFYFKWRLGDIYYTKSGSGQPLLLVHDLDYASSGSEWSAIINSLREHFTVYTIDLLGCGRSEKPNLTYTNYLYVQLLCDFIKSEIGHRTNIITTGESVSFVTMACNTEPDLFDRLMFINPKSLMDYCQVPGKHGKMYKFFLDLPLFGTLFYNIASSRRQLEELFRRKYFYNPYVVRPLYVDKYYEAAHLGECPKAVFSSLRCNYAKCNIVNAFKKINNSIYIIGGKANEDISEVIDEYKAYNPAIEYSLIPNTRLLPQLENSAKVLEYIYIFFS
ncbi:alpha/beta fold hydrolase [Clostridium sp. AM58-1XD]|uniref:alpha/beta fold hydrolase n=1 Tax=Clostridium sp. AM58-1XD TaxID=2292307 RepID=UPI000E5236D8|nr:alpha/beta fold hydrolase [Clostridium sp. AM58-1XD]RGY97400.1 alpha/beta hydrolase [Clostridium sp. AM58-1XD]